MHGTLACGNDEYSNNQRDIRREARNRITSRKTERAASCAALPELRTNDKGNYKAEFPLHWMQKDMHLASVSAYESGVAMPLTNAAKELYRLAMREGHSGQDFSAIYDYLSNNHDFATIDQKSSVLG